MRRAELAGDTSEPVWLVRYPTSDVVTIATSPAAAMRWKNSVSSAMRNAGLKPPTCSNSPRATMRRRRKAEVAEEERLIGITGEHLEQLPARLHRVPPQVLREELMRRDALFMKDGKYGRKPLTAHDHIVIEPDHVTPGDGPVCAALLEREELDLELPRMPEVVGVDEGEVVA